MKYNFTFLASIGLILTLLPLFTGAVPFSFHQFLQGAWNISYTRTSILDKKLEMIGYPEKAQWLISNANETLTGSIINGEETFFVKVIFDEDSANQSGKFTYLTVNEDFQVLFDFNFVPTSEESFLSTGEWNDPNYKGIYQFTVENPVTFSVVIYADKGTSDDKSPQFITLQAHKKVDKPEATFLQRFGFPIAMFAFMIISQVFKHRMQPTPEASVPAAPRSKAAAKQAVEKKSN